MMRGLKHVLRAVVMGVMRLAPVRVTERLAYGLLAGKSCGLSAEEALRMLFRVDQKLYDLQGAEAIRYGKGIHPKHRLIGYHDFFIRHINHSDRVLDVGCGIGVVAHDVAQATGATVVGVDRDAAKISEARARFQHSRLTFQVGDALTDLPQGSFDMIILSNLLEHLENRVEFLRAVAQRLAPKRFLVRVPLFERDWRVALKEELQVDYYLDPTHMIEHRFHELFHELETAGLVVRDSHARWGEVWVVAEPTRHSHAGEDSRAHAAALTKEASNG